MRIWRTNQQILANPTSWVAGNLLPSSGAPGQYTVQNDDGTIFGIDNTGAQHNYPAGTDNDWTRCFLPEARTTIAFGATGYTFGIQVFA